LNRENKLQQGDAVDAALGRVALLGAEGGDPQVVRGKPVPELVEKVQGGVDGTPDSRMVTLALAVVLATCNVYGCGPVEARDAVTGVEIEPEVADLEGDQFGHAEAADGGERNHEAVPVVTGGLGPPAEHGDDQEAVDRKQEGRRATNQAGEAPGPGGEFAEARDGRAQPSDLVAMLDRGPDRGDDRARCAHAEQFPRQGFQDVGGHG
jgi:hypothetical protein